MKGPRTTKRLFLAVGVVTFIGVALLVRTNLNRREVAQPIETVNAERLSIPGPSTAETFAAPVSNSSTVLLESEPNVEFATPVLPRRKVSKPIPASEAGPQILAPASVPSRPQKRALQDPLAREALSLVGAVPGAETYWIDAINDPSIPPSERSDLIEDLNEDGLSDPPSPEDLPVIVSRLSLLEDIASDPMDDTNADAFKEAYKDLVNIFYRLTQQ